MSVTASDLQDWIGTEVLDSAGEKVGKLDELYFRGDEPLAAGIRSGLAGRKHHAAVLLGATVGRDSLRLSVGEAALVATDAHRLEVDQLTELAAQDRRLEGMAPGELESWTDREQRLREQAQAAADAERLQAEVVSRAEDEEAAAIRAREAEDAAESARLAREDAEARALRARDDARTA